jgi:hypothetical protein
LATLVFFAASKIDLRGLLVFAMDIVIGCA